MRFKNRQQKTHTPLTVESLNLQHRNECREDFGFGPLHHLLISLQDTLQDQGEGRQDVRSCCYHAEDGKRAVTVFIRDEGVQICQGCTVDYDIKETYELSLSNA